MVQKASLIGKCSQCGPDSSPGDPWGPGKPPTVSPGPHVPHPGQSLVLSPLFGCLVWEVGPAPFTDGETRAQRRGGWIGTRAQSPGAHVGWPSQLALWRPVLSRWAHQLLPTGARD